MVVLSCCKEKPHLGTVQRSTVSGEPSLNGYIHIIAPASMAQGTLKKRQEKDGRSQNARKSAGKLSLLEIVA